MKNLKNKIKNRKGITLISLVLTIIILLLLAGVALSMLLGNNGIIKRTQTAKDEYQNSANEENKRLEEIYSKLLIADSDKTSLGNVDMKTLKQLILDTSYPIGSVYISTSDIDPATTLGGQWESYGEGRTLVGAGTGTDTNRESQNFAAGNIGGEYKHTLTTAEMPSHTHSATYAQPYSESRSSYGFSVGQSLAVLITNATINTTSAGSSQSHNIVQPYIVTYMWKRIS